MVKEDFRCSLCGAPFKDYRSNHRKFCGLKCSHKHQSNVRSAGEEYRALRKIWGDMKRYAAKEIAPGVATAEVDVGWQASFFIFQRWASAAGYSPGQRFARIDKSKGYKPSNCHFI